MRESQARKLFRSICGAAMEENDMVRNLPVFNIGGAPCQRDWFYVGGVNQLACTWFTYNMNHRSMYDIPSDSPALRVSFNPTFYDLMDDEEIESVIRHETAHVIAGLYAQHNIIWSGIAKALGAIPESAFTIRRWRDLPSHNTDIIISEFGNADNVKPSLDRQTFTSESVDLSQGSRLDSW